MKRTEVTIVWQKGLHARPAARLVRLARSFSSTICFKCNNQVANAKSILNILLLCATLGTTIQIEVFGEDEDQAIQAVQQSFASEDE